MRPADKIEIEFAPGKTIGFSVFMLFFGCILFALSALPIMFWDFARDLGEWLVGIAIAILLPLSYVILSSAWRYLAALRDQRPLAVLTKYGVEGYNGAGSERTLSWKEVSGVVNQTPYGNIFIMGALPESMLARIFIGGLGYWNPNSIIIPTCYTKAKADKVMEAISQYAPDIEFSETRA